MNRLNRAAIYCRLSKDDEQSGESVSIETQRMLLTNYCLNQNFEIVDLYIDDGYSGLNFNRPSFKRLISDLEDGKFDIVITKDLSRLGRDYIQTGYYIDVYFSTKQIRYIAVNDGIDTLSDNNDIAPFKNILNDMYAKDLSRKVKSAKHQRAKNGLYISAQPPYGYKVDPLNRNKLIIDPEPTKVVKQIFELAKLGNNYSEISRILELQKTISPSAYKALNGDTRFLKFASKEQIYKWPYQTVKAIISNRVYVGDMVNHKVETVNYKTKERVRIPIENQIVVQHTHEAIIERALFESINNSFAMRRQANHCYENIFKGLLFCAECGEEMQLIARKTKTGDRPMFRCAKHAVDPSSCIHHHYIYYDDILNEIKNQISFQIEKFVNSSMYDELCKNVMTEIFIRVQEAKKSNLQKELQIVNKKIKDTFKVLSAESINANELELLYKHQKRLMQKFTAPIDNDINIDSNILKDIEDKVKEFIMQILIIDKNSLGLFVSKIEVGHLEKDMSKKMKMQKINIHYRFKPLEFDTTI